MTPTPASPVAGQPQPDWAGLPPTCEIRNWRVFADGVNKNQIYTFADIDEIARTFPLVARHVTPHVGVGHDKAQRLAASVGVPSSGDVVGCRSDGRGGLYLDLANVPTWLGAQINAGRYPSGSVELKRDFRPPADPANPIPGRYLDGVALLGEEQPAVKGCPPPRAVFADGTPVPPCWDPVPVPKGPLSPPAPDPGVHHAACFSDASPPPGGTTVDPNLIAQLKALPPDQLQALLAAVGAPAAPTPADDPNKMQVGDGTSSNQAGQIRAMHHKDPDDHNTQFSAGKPKWFADFEAKQEAFAADCAKRFSAYDAKFSEDEKKKEDEAKTAAVAMSEGVVDDAIRQFRVQPADRDLFVKQGVEVATTRAFADKTGPDAFHHWKAGVLARPQLPEALRVPNNPRPTVGPDGKPAPVPVRLNDGGRALLGTLKVTNPRTVERLTAAG